MIRKVTQDIPFIDLIELFRSIEDVPASQKLATILKNGGVEFFDPETGLFVKKPCVSLAGVGGAGFDLSSVNEEDLRIPLRNTTASLSVNEIMRIFEPLQAAGGFLSYLNTGNLKESEMIDIMVEHNHFSTLHLSYINIAIFGISSLVENEINCQRDTMHIARITEARTNVQTAPPVVVQYPEHLPLYQAVRDFSQQKRSEYKKGDFKARDFFESVNAVYPASKATGVIISVTLKNLRKFVELLNDEGKEEEFKRILVQINDFCHILWPGYFKETKDYAYQPPKHY